MENAVEALKMAGFMLIFIMGLSVAIVMLSRATSTADSIIQNEDRQASYQYIEVENPALGLSRTVTLADIIPTLYRYHTERYAVQFYDASGAPLEIYTDEGGEPRNDLDLNTEIWYDSSGNRHTASWVGNRQLINDHIDSVVKELYNSGYSNTNFVERLGIVEDNTADPDGSGDTDIDINKNYKRIITYTVMP